MAPPIHAVLNVVIYKRYTTWCLLISLQEQHQPQETIAMQLCATIQLDFQLPERFGLSYIRLVAPL